MDPATASVESRGCAQIANRAGEQETPQSEPEGLRKRTGLRLLLVTAREPIIGVLNGSYDFCRLCSRADRRLLRVQGLEQHLHTDIVRRRFKDVDEVARK